MTWFLRCTLINFGRDIHTVDQYLERRHQSHSFQATSSDSYTKELIEEIILLWLQLAISATKSLLRR